MLTSAYIQHYKVGTYTSPHLLTFNERIRIQQQPIHDTALCDAFEVIEQARHLNKPHMARDLTYFEFITLSALWIFKKANIEIMILEVGIGGRLDATNIIDADLAIITTIGLDHMGYLGKTREAIAKEKSGIFRANQLAICGDSNPPKTLIQAAKRLSTQVSYMGKDFDYAIENSSHWRFKNHFTHLSALPLPILEISNAAIAFQALNLLNNFLPVAQSSYLAVINTSLAGRCEVKKTPAGTTIIFDVAHNPQATAHLAIFLEHYKNQHRSIKISAIFGMLQDKDIINTIKPMITHIDEWHVAEIDDKRTASKEQLQAAFDAYQLKPIWHDNFGINFFEQAPNHLWVAFGSFLVVSAVMGSFLKLD